MASLLISPGKYVQGSNELKNLKDVYKRQDDNRRNE